MNKILLSAGVFLVAALLFAPWEEPVARGAFNQGYSFLFDPPPGMMGGADHVQIALDRYIPQCLVALLIGLGLGLIVERLTKNSQHGNA